MDEQRIDEIVREVEKERPRWVLVHGQPGAGRTTLARRLVVAAVHELSSKLDKFAPGFTAQVYWYSRDDQFGNRTQAAHTQLAKVVKEVAGISMREAPVTYIPKAFDDADVLHDIIGANIAAVVFDDIWPGLDTCEAILRRLVSRDIGILVTVIVGDESTGLHRDYGVSTSGRPVPWKAYRLVR